MFFLFFYVLDVVFILFASFYNKRYALIWSLVSEMNDLIDVPAINTTQDNSFLGSNWQE